MKKHIATAALLLLAVLTGCTPGGTTSQETSPAAPSTTIPDGAPAGSTPTAATTGTALSLLGALEVKGRAPKTGYEREAQYGPAWSEEVNGCDTRNRILQRDLTDVVLRDGCVVLTGTLTDPYGGEVIAFARDGAPGAADTDGDGVPGNSMSVQVDHVVALSDSWQTGAQQWDQAKRVAFANDPLNLVAADGPLNMAKGDGDTATWLPPNKVVRCAYVARQVAVKAKYQVWVTDAEARAMGDVLNACPDEPAPSDPDTSLVPRGTSADVVPEVPVTAPQPEGAGGADPQFSSCKQAKAAGLGPYVEGVDPEYAWYKDGDGDGTTCE